MFTAFLTFKPTTSFSASIALMTQHNSGHNFSDDRPAEGPGEVSTDTDVSTEEVFTEEAQAPLSSPEQAADVKTASRPVWTAILFITALAGVVSLFALLGILVDYFLHLGFGRYFTAVGLWGLPTAFAGVIVLLVWGGVERSRANRRAARTDSAE